MKGIVKTKLPITVIDTEHTGYRNFYTEAKPSVGYKLTYAYPPPPPPPKNHKNIWFLSETGSDPLKITNLSSQHSMLGHHRHASETPFICRFAGGPVVVFRSPLPSSTKKKVVKAGPPLTKLSGSAHAANIQICRESAQYDQS